MNERIKDLLMVVSMVSLGIICIVISYKTGSYIEDTLNTTVYTLPSEQPTFYNKSPDEGLKEALIYYDIKHPEVVYAQAVLETGNFKYVKHNNLFGLYNSDSNKYHKFNHWTESVIAYKEWIQGKYIPYEGYYRFLKRIGYAEDPYYNTKLRKIVINESRRSKERSLEADSTVNRK